jgi:hypothetical protein
MPELNVPAWPDTPPVAPPVPPTPRTVTDPCACGHGKDAHDHYRPGTDCGACGADVCDEFRPEGGGFRKTLRRWGLVG